MVDVVVDVSGNDKKPTSRLNEVVTMFVLGLKGSGGGEKGGGDKGGWSRIISEVSIRRMSHSFAFVWFKDVRCRRSLLGLSPSLSKSKSSSSLNSDRGSILGMTTS